eukprot:jgi/Undpi1/12426/HiC_scaffold_5.g02098.m1
MFIYLSKKIAIPNGTKLESLAWNPAQGWIACGGSNGLTKVLKLESVGVAGKEANTPGAEGGKGGAAASGSNLSMNQTLEGHEGSVVCVTWNATYSKLTTCDERGLIIVWMLHKGLWFEEMINNRNKSAVRDMKWTSNGQKICIIYADGAVIVGSVDGNRLWGKELEMGLQNVEWSPDGRRILFVTTAGEVLVYDAQGKRVKAMTLPEGARVSSGDGADAHLSSPRDGKYDDSDDEDKQGEGEKDGGKGRVISLDWYDGAEGLMHPQVPTLCLALEGGTVQTSRGVDDANPIVINAHMTIRQARWNTNGTVLALSGSARAQLSKSGQPRDLSVVKLYSPYGAVLRTLKVPGNGISSMAWEGGGLRIALAVDAYIYFANIRPDYAWTSTARGSVLAYAYQKPDKTDTQVCFWDIKAGERRVKQHRNLKLISGGGEHVCIVAGPDEQGRHALILVNSIGSPVEERLLPHNIFPLYMVMSGAHVVVAGEAAAYVWQYKNQESALSVETDPGALIAAALKRTPGAGRERVVDPDNLVSPACAPEAYAGGGGGGESTSNPITALAVSESALLLGREDGTICRYTLPHISLENRYTVRTKPQKLALNCNSSLVAVIDSAGLLSVQDLEAKAEGDTSKGMASVDPGPWAGVERRDAWDAVWATDDPNQLAAMEKTKLVIFNSGEAEEPVPCSGHLCRLQGLEARHVLVDAVMAAPESPDRAVVVDVETRALVEARELMTTDGLQEAYQAISKKPHLRLWRLLAEQALEALDLGMAEKAFVLCGKDAFQGVRLVKRLSTMSDRIRRRAEVSTYFDRFEEAENMLREIDRRDLTISLRERLGDWFRVVQLLKQGGGDDAQLLTAWGKVGEHYAERGKWGKAVPFFKQAKNLEMMAECFYRLEDYAGLRELLDVLPHGSNELANLGTMFESVGLGEDAVRALLRLGNPKGAIDACVRLNHWGRAVDLAEKHDFPQIEALIARHTSQLLQKGDPLQAVEVYRMAGKATDAALLLAKLAEDAGRRRVDPLRAKKLHVLAACEVERHRKRAVGGAGASRQGRSAAEVAAATAATLHTLMATSANDADDKRAAKVLDSAWRGAEAYHYYMLAQRQLYNGNTEQAVRTAIRCAEFEDILSPWDVYCLVALTAYHSGYMGVCSRAFVKLETLPNESPEKLEAAQTLALKIFTRNPPMDPQPLERYYLECLDEGRAYQACTASGQAISSRGGAKMCKTCRHFAIESDLGKRSHCHLCHAPMR